MKYTTLLIFFFTGLAQASNSKTLTIERIFDSPELDGPQVVGLKFSPNGERLTYLGPKKENYEKRRNGFEQAKSHGVESSFLRKPNHRMK